MKKTKAPIPKSMEEIVKTAGPALVPVRQGEVVEVSVLQVSKHRVLVDVGGVTLGFVPEREFSFDTNELKSGDKVLAYVLSPENEDGYVVLSLRRADRERIWRTLGEKQQTGELITIKAKAANRGGLLIELAGIEGFLPVSQLSSAHYPKVEGGDKSAILGRLQTIVGEPLKVKILSLDKNTNKLIFSEKAAAGLVESAALEGLKVGDILEGAVTGVVPFGLFVNVGDVEGLVHISEVSWERVEDLGSLYKVGQKVKVKVLKIEGNRVYFTIKQLSKKKTKSKKE